jgi:hypothetical protein
MDNDNHRIITSSPNSWDILTNIFNSSSVIILLWFLAIIIIAYLCITFFIGSNVNSFRFSRLIDIILFSVLFIYILTISLRQNNPNYYSEFLEFINEPYSIFAILFFILAFYLTIYIISLPMSPEVKPYSIGFIENIAWLLFLILLIFDFFKIVLNVHLVKLLPTTLTTTMPIRKVSDSSGNKISDSSGNKVKDSSGNKPNEVFNISNNLYTYDEAQNICKAFDSTLATYDQIENSYNDGAEWCAYGWSDNQMAFFPTQKSTWNKLQKSDKTKNACGRPGINGGYMANPNIRFGVNCYGKKPDPNQFELNMMQSNVPTNIVDSELDAKVKFWKDNRDKLLVINSFNHNKWSEY